MQEEFKMTHAAMENMEAQAQELPQLFNRLLPEQQLIYKELLWRWVQLNEAMQKAMAPLGINTGDQPA